MSGKAAIAPASRASRGPSSSSSSSSSPERPHGAKTAGSSPQLAPARGAAAVAPSIAARANAQAVPAPRSDPAPTTDGAPDRAAPAKIRLLWSTTFRRYVLAREVGRRAALLERQGATKLARSGPTGISILVPRDALEPALLADMFEAWAPDFLAPGASRAAAGLVSALRACAAAKPVSTSSTIAVPASRHPESTPAAARQKVCACCLQPLGTTRAAAGVAPLRDPARMAYGHPMHALCAATLLAAGQTRCPCLLFNRHDDCVRIVEESEAAPKRADATLGTTNKRAGAEDKRGEVAKSHRVAPPCRTGPGARGTNVGHKSNHTEAVGRAVPREPRTAGLESEDENEGQSDAQGSAGVASESEGGDQTTTE